MSSLTKFKYSQLVLGTFLFILAIFGSVALNSADIQADEPVDCIIIQYSYCPDCVNKYRTYVEPFFIEYQSNGSVDFAFIDASVETEFFFEQMGVYNITVGDYGNFPWVIFIWENDKTVVLDIEAIIEDNDIIYTTLSSILVDIGYIPPDNNGTTLPSFDVIDISLLVYAIVIVGGITLIATSGSVLIDKFTNLEFKPRRIEKNRLIIFLSLSIVSLIALTYQFLDYLRGGCGCASTDLAKTLLFRKYEIYRFFDFEISFAFLGISIITAVLLQVVLLGFSPLPLEIAITKEKSFKFTKAYGEYWYLFVIFQLFLTLGALFYLFYLELFVINFICILCTISQIIIIINTILIMTWNPFPKREKE